MGKDEVKLSQFADDLLYMEKRQPYSLHQKAIWINECSKVAAGVCGSSR